MSIYGPKSIESTKNKYIDPIERKRFWEKVPVVRLVKYNCYSIKAVYQWEYIGTGN